MHWSYIYILFYAHTFTLPSMLIGLAKVFRVGWWMGHYASQTPKRHFAYSNSPWIKSLDRGVLQWKSRLNKGHKKVQTAVAYQSKTGKKCYQGTAALKKTENLGLNGLTTVFRSIACLLSRFNLSSKIEVSVLFCGHPFKGIRLIQL